MTSLALPRTYNSPRALGRPVDPRSPWPKREGRLKRGEGRSRPSKPVDQRLAPGASASPTGTVWTWVALIHLMSNGAMGTLCVVELVLRTVNMGWWPACDDGIMGICRTMILTRRLWYLCTMAFSRGSL